MRLPKTLVRSLAIGGIGALLATIGGPVEAAPGKKGRVRLDRVVAVVGDDIVLMSELRRTTDRHPLLQEALAQLPRNAPPETLAQKRRDVESKVLEELIDIVLLRAEAEKFDIRITEKDVDRATEDIARQYGLTLADLRRQVEESVEYGSWVEYRAEVRDQILQYKVPHYLATWSVSEAQVREHYRKMTKDESAKVRVHQYVFNPPTQKTSDRDRAFAGAQAVSGRLRKGEEPAKVADELGKAATERTIGRGDVAPALEDALFAAKEKRVVGPLASGQGYVVFTVDEHVESAALSYEQAKARIREQLEQEAFFKAQAEMREQMRAKAHIDIRL